MKTDIRNLLSFLQASIKDLEWTVSDGRTFQILGTRNVRLNVYWEFAPGRQTCRPLFWTEAQAAFDAALAQDFLLYSKGGEKAETLTREQLLDRVEEMFPELERR